MSWFFYCPKSAHKYYSPNKLDHFYNKKIFYLTQPNSKSLASWSNILRIFGQSKIRTIGPRRFKLMQQRNTRSKRRCIVASPHHCLTKALHHYSAASLHHRITESLNHWITSTMRHLSTLLPLHFIPASLDQCITKHCFTKALHHFITLLTHHWSFSSPHHCINVFFVNEISVVLQNKANFCMKGWWDLRRLKFKFTFWGAIKTLQKKYLKLNSCDHTVLKMVKHTLH